jgi:uncharacterized protein (TIGR00369 family)
MRRLPDRTRTMTDPDSNFIARLMRGEVPQHPIGATLGCTLLALDVDAGRLEAEYRGTPAFLNPAGQVQGGMLAAMLDDVTASLATACGAGARCATLDLHTAFLRPASVGPIRAVAEMVRRGRGVSTVRGELSQQGRPVAIATATCRMVQEDAR